MTFRILSLLTGILVLISPGNSEEYEFTRSIKIENQGESLAGLYFDKDSFYPGHLEIQGADRKPVPLLIRKVPKQRIVREQTRLTHRVTSFQPDEENGILMACEITEPGKFPDRLVIETPLHDFERKVRVESSHNGTQWNTILSDYLVFDYRQIADIRRTEIPLPEMKPAISVFLLMKRSRKSRRRLRKSRDRVENRKSNWSKFMRIFGNAPSESIAFHFSRQQRGNPTMGMNRENTR